MKMIKMTNEFRKTRLRQSISLAISLTLLCASGCKNFFTPVTSTMTTPVVNTGNYAYVASANTVSATNPVYTLSGFSVGTGTLTELTGFPLALNFAPTAAVVTPSNALLYVSGASSSSQGIYGYTISSAGALASILNSTNTQLLANANIVSMAVSADGNWLLALDGTPNGSLVTVREYAISSSGQLTAQAGVQYAVTGGATIALESIAIAPSGNYVAVALGTGGDVLFSFVTSTGALAPIFQQNTPTDSSADQALAFDAAGNTLYVVRSGSNGGVVPYVISNAGANLTAAANAPFALGAGPSSILIDATGTYLYVGNKVDSKISGFSIGTGGVLTPLTGSPYASGASVDALARDNSGKYILSTALGGVPDLKMYSFDATNAGALDAVTSIPTGTSEPAGAVAIAMTHPGGS